MQAVAVADRRALRAFRMGRLGSKSEHSALVERLFAAYQLDRDPAIKEVLVELSLGLADYLAGRFNNKNVPLEDLQQVARMGLVNAVERFNPDLGWEFTTFATPTIVGEIKRYFRDKGWGIRVPRRLQEAHLRYNRVHGELGAELGRDPSHAEMAERMGCSEEEVTEALAVGIVYRSESLDADIESGGYSGAADDRPLSYRIGHTDHQLESVEDRAYLAAAISSLPARQQAIVRMRFEDDFTQSQIGKVIGIGQMHVSRLLAKSLDAMRDVLECTERTRDIQLAITDIHAGPGLTDVIPADQLLRLFEIQIEPQFVQQLFTDLHRRHDLRFGNDGTTRTYRVEFVIGALRSYQNAHPEFRFTVPKYLQAQIDQRSGSLTPVATTTVAPNGQQSVAAICQAEGLVTAEMAYQQLGLRLRTAASTYFYQLARDYGLTAVKKAGRGVKLYRMEDVLAAQARKQARRRKAVSTSSVPAPATPTQEASVTTTTLVPATVLASALETRSAVRIALAFNDNSTTFSSLSLETREQIALELAAAVAATS